MEFLCLGKGEKFKAEEERGAEKSGECGSRDSNSQCSGVIKKSLGNKNI